MVEDEFKHQTMKNIKADKNAAPDCPMEFDEMCEGNDNSQEQGPDAKSLEKMPGIRHANQGG